MMALPLGLAGCATVVGSFDQPISVNAVCEGAIVTGATCTLTNDKGRWTLTAPASATIRKSPGDLSISCQSGDSTGTTQLASMSNASFANVVVGGGVGYLVDSGTGAGFDYPAAATVVLNPPCFANAVGEDR